MQLLTKAIEQQLDKNWPDDKGLCKPAVKFFNPSGLGTWLIVSRDPEWPDCLFGLADLGYPELGSVLLSDLQSVKCPPLGLGIERDLHFTAKWPIAVYAEAARNQGHITFSNAHLEAAALALKQGNLERETSQHTGGSDETFC